MLAGIARGDSFQLTDGSTLNGDIVSASDASLKIKISEDTYTNVTWDKFSQNDLKRFANDPGMQRFKLADFATPFIEVTDEQRREKTDVGPLKDVPRLKRPEAGSFFGAMLSSPVGFFVLLILYAAGIYAAFEVAIYRRRPRGLVCGLAAIPGLGFLSPIIFLSMAAPPLQSEEEESYAQEPQPGAPPPPAPAAPPGYTVPGMAPAAAMATPEPETTAPETHGLKLAQSPAPSTTPSANLPPPQIFQRGAFMFNRRFFETKFPGFFGVVRKDSDKDMVLFIKAARGQYIAERISRISANDMYVQVRKGEVSEEVMVPFTEVQEVQLKHKDSP
jgi:hypothetical protein